MPGQLGREIHFPSDCTGAGDRTFTILFFSFEPSLAATRRDGILKKDRNSLEARGLEVTV